MKDLKACLAEMFGTFALVFVSIGAIFNANHQQMDLVGIALAYGLATAAMVSATVAVSGGHLNPAVSFGAFLGGRMGFSQALRYILAQLAGAVLAGFLCVTVFSAGVVSTATPDLGKDVSIGTAIVVEATLTFLVVFAMFGTVMDARGPKLGGLCVGLVVAAGVLFGQPLTGAAMNPARVFGPALVSGHFANHAVYWIGPMLGAALAGLLYSRFLILPDELPTAQTKKK
ncbi:MAG: aquaporin [Verrucomicrobia bacterium]|nr:aquaporin [Verrucomicrobiota bacterium]